MLARRAYGKLQNWKQQEHKKALCILGARQIGKTTLIRKFAQDNYEVFLEINFILDAKAEQIFAGALDVDTIITGLTAYSRQQLIPGKTLIFFDEIQVCPAVRTAIKFLVEDGRFDYIESGSLLGVNCQEVKSYPVGFEEIYNMYPMDFEEFLWANKVQQETIDYLRSCWEQKNRVNNAVHEVMLKLFYTYIVVGGMPAVVQSYVNNHDIAAVIKEQNTILELYRLDISKYTKDSDKLKVKAIFDSIPSQLNNKNRRFILTDIDKNGRQLRYQKSFLWLDAAGVALPCYNVTEPQPPLQLNAKHNLFKLYMGDVGLLCAACMDNLQFDLLQGNIDINLGSILENAIAQSLKGNGLSLYYFDSKKYGELDFVLQNGMSIDLLEIKSGNDFKKHRAMDNVSSISAWSFKNKYIFCKGNVEVDDSCVYYPLYMIMFYRAVKPEGQMLHTIDISVLQHI